MLQPELLLEQLNPLKSLLQGGLLMLKDVFLAKKDGPENEWPWQNKYKLYDTTFGNSYYQIMRDVTIREQIMNGVYDIHE